MSLTMTARLLITDGTVTPKSDPETYLVADVLNPDSDQAHYLVSSIGGDDVDRGAWPEADFGFSAHAQIVGDYLVVTIDTDLPDDYTDPEVDS